LTFEEHCIVTSISNIHLRTIPRHRPHGTSNIFDPMVSPVSYIKKQLLKAM
jgi:hypothetical protein